MAVGTGVGVAVGTGVGVGVGTGVGVGVGDGVGVGAGATRIAALFGASDVMGPPSNVTAPPSSTPSPEITMLCRNEFGSDTVEVPGFTATSHGPSALPR